MDTRAELRLKIYLTSLAASAVDSVTGENTLQDLNDSLIRQASAPDSNIRLGSPGLLSNVTKFIKYPNAALLALLAVYGVYLGGRSISNWTKRKMSDKPYGTPSPLVGIERTGPGNDYKFQGRDVPSRSQEVPDYFYQPVVDNPAMDLERIRSRENSMEGYGIPSGFGTTPGSFGGEFQTRIPLKPDSQMLNASDPISKFNASRIGDTRDRVMPRKPWDRLSEPSKKFRVVEAQASPVFKNNIPSGDSGGIFSNFAYPTEAQLPTMGVGYAPNDPGSIFEDTTGVFGGTRRQPMTWSAGGSPMETELAKYQAYQGTGLERNTWGVELAVGEALARVKAGVTTPEQGAIEIENLKRALQLEYPPEVVNAIFNKINMAESMGYMAGLPNRMVTQTGRLPSSNQLDYSITPPTNRLRDELIEQIQRRYQEVIPPSPSYEEYDKNLMGNIKL